MKLFAVLALAGIASALELEQNYLAQVAEVDADGVVHPDDGNDPTTPTILDRAHSEKKIGRLSYQIFFDNVVNGEDVIGAASSDEGACGAEFVEGKHICCYQVRVLQPFLETTTTERYATYVSHNCEGLSAGDFPWLTSSFDHLEFSISGAGSSEDREYDLTNWAKRESISFDEGSYSFSLGSQTTSADEFAAIFWSIDTFSSDDFSVSAAIGESSSA